MKNMYNKIESIKKPGMEPGLDLSLKIFLVNDLP